MRDRYPQYAVSARNKSRLRCGGPPAAVAPSESREGWIECTAVRDWGQLGAQIATLASRLCERDLAMREVCLSALAPTDEPEARP